MELLECLSYFQNLWAERAARPEPGNDFISMLAHGPQTRNMPPMEYLGNLLLLIVGGNDTTRSTMTASVNALNLFPEQYATLKRRPELIPSMVSEVIRWQTPLAHMRRTALEDFELAGKSIRKGDKVAMWYLSGNHDDTKFERPGDLWIERPNVRNHLAFGFGIHRCVGNRLAEMQLRVLWEEILKRYEHIEVLDAPERTINAFVNGYTWMPVRLHPRAREV
jgi:cytochrome P450